jgi:hypothetical protein
MKSRPRRPGGDQPLAPFYDYDGEGVVQGYFPVTVEEARMVAERMTDLGRRQVIRTPIFPDRIVPFVSTIINHATGDFETVCMGGLEVPPEFAETFAEAFAQHGMMLYQAREALGHD